MKKATILAIVLILGAPSFVFSDSFIFRMGYFMPSTLNKLSLVDYPDSLLAIEFDQMSFRKSDFRGPMYGLGYEYVLTKQISLALTVDFFSRNRTAYYYDWVGFEFEDNYVFAFPAEDFPFGDGVGHNFRMSITPLQLSVRFTPLGRRMRFVPYLGGGVGLYFWKAAIPLGQLIEFPDPGDPSASYWYYDYETDAAYENPTDPDLQDVPIYPVYAADLREPLRTSLGYHVFGGIQIPIGYRITLDAEVRYNIAKGNWKTGSAFLGFDDFDLGGLVLSGGLSFWF